MSTHDSAPQRQRLMYTTVADHPAAQSSDRWVEASHFELWRFLMEARHGFAVQRPRPCVWLPSDESERCHGILAHQGFRADVVRMTFEMFDPDTGVADLRTRFVAATDVELVRDRLAQHFAVKRTITTLTADPGTAVSSLRDARACA